MKSYTAFYAKNDTIEEWNFDAENDDVAYDKAIEMVDTFDAEFLVKLEINE